MEILWYVHMRSTPSPFRWRPKVHWDEYFVLILALVSDTKSLQLKKRRRVWLLLSIKAQAPNFTWSKWTELNATGFLSLLAKHLASLRCSVNACRRNQSEHPCQGFASTPTCTSHLDWEWGCALLFLSSMSTAMLSTWQQKSTKKWTSEGEVVWCRGDPN